MPSKKQATEKLKTVKPSGKRDENFFELVFEVARQIPKGRVTSYGAIAECNGMLTGKFHFSPPEKMEQLLKKEGIKVKDDKILDFKKHFWNPVDELGF